MVIAAALAMKTKRMRIGTNVLLLPLYHPVRLAESVLQDAKTREVFGGNFDDAALRCAGRQAYEKTSPVLAPHRRLDRLFSPRAQAALDQPRQIVG